MENNQSQVNLAFVKDETLKEIPLENIPNSNNETKEFQHMEGLSNMN